MIQVGVCADSDLSCTPVNVEGGIRLIVTVTTLIDHCVIVGSGIQCQKRIGQVVPVVIRRP